MQTNQPEPCLLCLVYAPQEAAFFCLNNPRSRCQATRDHPYSLDPTKVIQTSQPWTVCQALLHLLCRNSVKMAAWASPAPTPAASWPMLAPPHVAPRGVPCLLLQDLVYNDLCFPEPLLCLLLWLLLTDLHVKEHRTVCKWLKFKKYINISKIYVL